MKKIKLKELVEETNVKFGTSGVRSLVLELNDYVVYSYTKAFIKYIQKQTDVKNKKIAIAGDLRPSTERIMKTICKCLKDLNYEIINCGEIPTPALTFYGIENNIPSIMVTGSHIPDDRNGIKFNKSNGEILKEDEKDMLETEVEIDASLFDDQNNLIEKTIKLPIVNKEAEKVFIDRYKNFFKHDFLKNFHIGLYGHSAVGKDMLFDLLVYFGADVTKLGFSKEFIPVDTEAMRTKDLELAKEWSKKYKFDCVVSTDGDSDRPLIFDENGNWIRGDILGVLVSKFLKADYVVVPVSSNSAVEKTQYFKKIIKTKIGSPHVIEEMNNLVLENKNKSIVGYESNGGFLINSQIKMDNKILKKLPTRDSFIVILSILEIINKKNKPLSEIVNLLPAIFTSSNRIKDFPSQKSTDLISNLRKDLNKVKKLFYFINSEIKEINELDGLRIIFENDENLHLRPSGNAPELRVYSEATSQSRADQIVDFAISSIKSY